MPMELRRVAYRWFEDGDVKPPRGYTITPQDIHSGQARTRRLGSSHLIADAAEISDGEATYLVTVWICGATSLDAVAVEDESPGPVDCVGCRLAAAVPSGPVVYYAYAEDDTLLYVGSSTRVSARIRTHMAQSKWWPQVKRMSFDQHSTELQARRAEADAIYARPGLYNREGRKLMAPPPATDFLDSVEVRDMRDGS